MRMLAAFARHHAYVRYFDCYAVRLLMSQRKHIYGNIRRVFEARRCLLPRLWRIPARHRHHHAATMPAASLCSHMRAIERMPPRTFSVK